MRPRREIKRALARKGFRERQKGRDHDFFFFEHEGLVKAVFTKISRGRKYRDIDDSLLKRMSRQLHLSGSQFDQLIDCPMTEEGYVSVLIDRKIITPKSGEGTAN